jgi:hypothetical protein
MMKQMIAACVLCTMGVLVGSVFGGAIRAQEPPYVTTQILQSDLQNLPDQEVLTFTSTWQPGVRLPLHIHPTGRSLRS